MKEKKDILKTIKNIISDNNLSIYNVANIAGINRSTLQKALSGDRNLNLRQFNALINVLPISNLEKKTFYSDYLNLHWNKEQIARTNIIMDILSTLSDSFRKGVTPPVNTYNIHTAEHKSISGSQNVIEALKSLTVSSASRNDEVNICAYMPFSNDLFMSSVGYCLESCPKQRSVSVLFEFLKPGNAQSSENPIILKNILPLLLNSDDIYNFYYVYVDSYFYDNHLTPYPYYILYPDMAVLINLKLDSLVTITDKNAIESIRSIHRQNTENAITLNKIKLELADAVTHLMSNQIASDMYAISYEPCITTFVPPAMYADLIRDDFPDRDGFFRLIEERIMTISQTHKKYDLFDAESIAKFAEDGNLLIFEHPFLKKCSIAQRIEILRNIVNTMNDTTVVMRAYDRKNLNTSKRFEITNVQDLYNFSILIYEDNGYVRLIDIREPIISSCFIDFIHDILDTPLVYTYEETKTLIMKTIERLEQQL